MGIREDVKHGEMEPEAALDELWLKDFAEYEGDETDLIKVATEIGHRGRNTKKIVKWLRRRIDQGLTCAKVKEMAEDKAKKEAAARKAQKHTERKRRR
jgi:hypothetical protein